MDPNAALHKIRQIIWAAEQAQGLTPEGVSELIDLWMGLDQWMSKGGFLPTAWQR